MSSDIICKLNFYHTFGTVWFQCSASCGYGEQKRKVVCRAASAESCISVHKPEVVQKCYTGRSCEEDDLASFQQDGEALDTLYNVRSLY